MINCPQGWYLVVLMNLVVCSRFSQRALAEKFWGTKENLPQTTKFISTTKLDASGQLIMERRERRRRRRFPDVARYRRGVAKE